MSILQLATPGLIADPAMAHAATPPARHPTESPPPSAPLPARQQADAGTTDRAEPTAGLAREALEYLRSHAGTVAPNLQFSIDRDTGRMVIKVVDAVTKEVIRQIPPDEVLRLDKAMDKLKGLLLDGEA